MLSQALKHCASIDKGAFNDTKLLIINKVRIKPTKTKKFPLCTAKFIGNFEFFKAIFFQQQKKNNDFVNFQTANEKLIISQKNLQKTFFRVI